MQSGSDEAECSFSTGSERGPSFLSRQGAHGDLPWHNHRRWFVGWGLVASPTILELRGQVSRRLPRTQDAALSVRTGHSACRGSEWIAISVGVGWLPERQGPG